MTKDSEVRARLPKELKQAVASASAKEFTTESEWIRQTLIVRLRAIGLLSDDEPGRARDELQAA